MTNTKISGLTAATTPVAGTGAGYLRISGIPFNISGTLASGAGREIALTGQACSVSYATATALDLNDYANASLVATGRKYSFVMTYFA